MVETMLRSGVPPHMGQSPEPGSPEPVLEAETRVVTMIVAIATTLKANSDLDVRDFISPLGCYSPSLVRGDFNVIKKEFIRAVSEDARAADPIPDWISP